MKEKEKELQNELNRINEIQPDDNLRYLINQVEVGNIEVSEKDRVLNILNEVKLGITSLSDKYNKAKHELKKN